LSLGIVGYAKGLIVVRSTGGLYYISLADSTTIKIADSAPSGDGLVIVGDTLYLVKTALDCVSVWQLNRSNGVTAEPLGFLLSAAFNTPATAALYKDSLCLVNARFGELPAPAEGEGDQTTFTELFNAVSVKRSGVAQIVESTSAPTAAPGGGELTSSPVASASGGGKFAVITGYGDHCTSKSNLTICFCAPLYRTTYSESIDRNSNCEINLVNVVIDIKGIAGTNEFVLNYAYANIFNGDGAGSSVTLEICDMECADNTATNDQPGLAAWTFQVETLWS
jgi:hypothetical protein